MTELGLFARYWTPGTVKTRLAASIGNDAAANVYRASLETTLRRFCGVADRRVAVFTPMESIDPFERLAAPHWQVAPQEGHDLGARMCRYFVSALQRGARRVVLMGSDSPTLPVDYVQQAFALLDRAPVVLGPATDGGYYLVGMSRLVSELFDEIAWSTPLVWQQTVARLDALAVPFVTLPPWHDFDNVSDLRHLHAELGPLAAHEAEYLPLLAVVSAALTERES